MAARPVTAGPGVDQVDTIAPGPEREEGPQPESGQAAPSPRPSSVRSQLLMLGVDLVAPIVLYYGLHSAGVGNLVALSVGAIPPALSAAVRIVRVRKVDRLAVMVIASMLAAIGVSLISGSPRFLLAKDGWLMGMWGLWFLLSVRSERPAAYLFTRPLLEGRRPFTAESWDSLWQRVPTFRRIWRVSSVMWGLGLLVDAAARVAMAYTLPVAVVPGLGGVLYPATFIVVQVITNVYYHRSGLWTVLGAPWARRRLDMRPTSPPGIGAAAATWAKVRQFPMTAAVTIVTAAVGAGQLLGGGVVLALQGDRGLLLDGQWWRLVSPMLVQPSGAGQYAFNLIGSALVGVAVERQLGPGKWLAVYLTAGLVGVIADYVWFPALTGGGSSDAVAGLIGALTVGWWVRRWQPGWPGYLYAAFFAAYLTGLAAAGVVAGTVAGGLTVAAVTTIRRHGPATWLRPLVCGLVVSCAVALISLRDSHGVGLITGVIVALLLSHPKKALVDGGRRG